MGGHVGTECCVFKEYVNKDDTDNLFDETLKLLNQNSKSKTPHNYYETKDGKPSRKTTPPIKKRKAFKSRFKSTKNNARPKRSRYQSVPTLKEELNETEIKLKQQMHQTKVLKQENAALRQENIRLKCGKKRLYPRPPTPPIVVYSMDEEDSPPDIRPVSPITIRITNGHQVKAANNISWNNDDTPARLSPLVDPLPDIRFSFAENVVKDGVTPSTDSPQFMVDKEEWKLFEECECGESCISIKRVVQSLQWYALFMNDEELLCNELDKHDYNGSLFNDYQHILHCHDMEVGYDKIVSSIGHKCDVNTCNGFKRYKSNQNVSTNVMGTIDRLHCYFMHLHC